MSQESPVSHTTVPAAEAETDLLDAEWLAAPSRRSRARVGLVVVLAVLLVFLGGVEVQKRWGSDDPASAGGRPTSGSLPGGGSFPAGGFSGLNGGGTPTGSQSTSGSRSGTSPGTTPAVIGTLAAIHGHTWTVRDLGGRSHGVRVTDATTVTRSLATATGPIRTGSTVTVQGTTRGGTVTATAITIR